MPGGDGMTVLNRDNFDDYLGADTEEESSDEYPNQTFLEGYLQFWFSKLDWVGSKVMEASTWVGLSTKRWFGFEQKVEL